MPRRGNARATPPRSSAVRERLIDAGRDVLLERGFLATTARVIAERAGVAPGSIHYHFASVDDLLAVSLERVTAERMAHYQRLGAGAPNLAVLGAAVGEGLAEDRTSGRFRLLAQMVAGAASGGTLAATVTAQSESWIELTADTLRRLLGDSPFGLVTTRDLSLAVVALFVGLELLDQVDAEAFNATGLFEALPAMLGFLATVTPDPTKDGP